MRQKQCFGVCGPGGFVKGFSLGGLAGGQVIRMVDAKHGNK